MDKKNKQIEYLEGLLDLTIKQVLETEVNYRTSQTLVFRSANNKDLLAAETQNKLTKDALEVKLRNIRAILEELKSGKLEV